MAKATASPPAVQITPPTRRRIFRSLPPAGATHAIRNQTFDVTYTRNQRRWRHTRAAVSWDDLICRAIRSSICKRSDRFVGGHHDGLAAGGTWRNVDADGAGDTSRLQSLLRLCHYRSGAHQLDRFGVEQTSATAAALLRAVIIDLPPPTDLQVGLDLGAADGALDEPLHLSWTSACTAQSAMQDLDRRRLPATPPGICRPPLGRASWWHGSAGQDVYPVLDTTMPGAAPGDYRIIVPHRHLQPGLRRREGGQQRARLDWMRSGRLSIRTLGVPLTTGRRCCRDRSGCGSRSDRIRRCGAETGAADDTSVNEVFIRYDQVPTSALFDATIGPLSTIGAHSVYQAGRATCWCAATRDRRAERR